MLHKPLISGNPLLDTPPGAGLCCNTAPSRWVVGVPCEPTGNLTRLTSCGQAFSVWEEGLPSLVGWGLMIPSKCFRHKYIFRRIPRPWPFRFRHRRRFLRRTLFLEVVITPTVLSLHSPHLAALRPCGVKFESLEGNSRNRCCRGRRCHRSLVSLFAAPPPKHTPEPHGNWGRFAAHRQTTYSRR